MPSVGELFVSLGFDVDSGKLESFNTGVIGLRNNVLGLMTQATQTVMALNAFAGGAGDKAVDMANFTAQTGFATNALMKWQAVVHKTNPLVGLDEAARQYESFGRKLAGIIGGYDTVGAGALSKLGVTPRQGMTPEQVLDEIRRNASDVLTRNGAGFLQSNLESLGIGGYFNAMQLSDRRFNSLAAGSLISQGDLDASKKLAENIAALEVSWDRFKQHAAGELAPALMSGINQVTKDFKTIGDAWKELGGTLKSGAEVIAGALLIAFAPISPLLAAIAAAGVAVHGLAMIVDAVRGGGNDSDKALMGWIRDKASEVTNHFNTTFNVHSTADSKTLTQDLKGMSDEQKNRNLTRQQLNSGVQY